MQGDCLQCLIGSLLCLGLGGWQGRRSLCILDMSHYDGFQGLRFMRRLETDPLDLEPPACRFTITALIQAPVAIFARAAHFDGHVRIRVQRIRAARSPPRVIAAMVHEQHRRPGHLGQALHVGDHPCHGGVAVLFRHPGDRRRQRVDHDELSIVFQRRQCQFVDIRLAGDVAGIEDIVDAFQVADAPVVLQRLHAGAHPDLPFQGYIDHIRAGHGMPCPVRSTRNSRHHIEQQRGLARLGLAPQDDDLAPMEHIAHQPYMPGQVAEVLRGMGGQPARYPRRERQGRRGQLEQRRRCRGQCRFFQFGCRCHH